MKNISSKNNNEIINNKLEVLYDFFEKNYQIDERDHLFIAVEPK